MIVSQPDVLYFTGDFIVLKSVLWRLWPLVALQVRSQQSIRGRVSFLSQWQGR